MGDERLRALRRTWRATGAVEDEAAFLRESLRVGALERSAVELAALCGDPAARAALGSRGESGPDADPLGVVDALAARSDHLTLVRACQAVAMLAHGQLTGSHRAIQDAAARALEALEAWCSGSTPEIAVEVFFVGEDLEYAVLDFDPKARDLDRESDGAAECVYRACWAAWDHCLLDYRLAKAEEHARLAVQAALYAGIPPVAIAHALRAAVRPWAQG